ncbi:MAG: hypothetical protein RIC14_05540 [Filomicrobium sp.]
MKILSMLGCVAAILIGVAAMSVDTWSNIEFQVGRPLVLSDLLSPGIWTSLTAAVVVVAISTAAALTVAGIAWRGRKWGLAAGLFLAFLCGAAYSLSATLDRVSTAKDGRVHEKQSHNLAIAEAKAAVEAARDQLGAAKAGMLAECKGRNPANLSDDGWPKCRRHWRAAESAQAKLASAEAQRSSLGAIVVEDSGAERVAALIPFGLVSPKQVTLYQPVLLPVALFLFGNLLVAFGFAGLSSTRIKRPQPVAVPMKDITPVDPVVVALKQIGRPVNNGELARLADMSDATVHRRVSELISQGVVSKARNGREVAISLR